MCTLHFEDGSRLIHYARLLIAYSAGRFLPRACHVKSNTLLLGLNDFLLQGMFHECSQRSGSIVNTCIKQGSTDMLPVVSC